MGGFRLPYAGLWPGTDLGPGLAGPPYRPRRLHRRGEVAADEPGERAGERRTFGRAQGLENVAVHAVDDVLPRRRGPLTRLGYRDDPGAPVRASAVVAMPTA